MLIEQIKADYLTHRKAKNTVAVALLSTLIGEVQTKEKVVGTMDDASVVAVIKKFIDGVNETIHHQGVSEQTTLELAILTEYMPKQLTIDEIRGILNAAAIANQGLAQKYMKQFYAGRYNGKDVNSALIPNKD
jgi:uncharacterized protein YqeY